MDAHVPQLKRHGGMSLEFTSTGICFVMDPFPDIEYNFELPPLLLDAITESYRSKAIADPDYGWGVPGVGENGFLVSIYGTNILVNHVLAYMRQRKLALLAG